MTAQLCTDQIPKQSISYAARFLCSDHFHVDSTGLRQRLGNTFFGHFIERNTNRISDADRFFNVPSDAFTFPIRVGCEIDFSCLADGLFQAHGDFFASFGQLINRCQVSPNACRDFVLIVAGSRQIADMANARHNSPFFTWANGRHDFLKLYALSRRFDNHQLHLEFPSCAYCKVVIVSNLAILLNV
ncbi:hypothetical protein D3C75_858900 [compost metagenome]